MYEDCQKNGFITNISIYAKIYGMNKSVGTVMCQIGYLVKEGFSKNATYTWHGRKPDESMMIEVLAELNKYCNRSKAPSTSPEKKLIPVSDVKERLRTEITSEIEAEITAKMIRASQASTILGINLLTLPQKKIKEFLAFVK